MTRTAQCGRAARRTGLPVLLVLAGICAAAVQARADGEQPKNWEAHEEQLRQRRAAAERRMAEQLDELRRSNPEAYEQTKRYRERQAAIDKILEAFRRGRLDQAGARRQLTPLIKSRADEEMKDIARRIESLRTELNRLEQLRAGPGKWVGGEVERMTPAPKTSTE